MNQYEITIVLMLIAQLFTFSLLWGALNREHG